MKVLKIFLIMALVACYSCREKEPQGEQAFYDNGQLNYEVPFENGKRHGKMVYYFSTGELLGYSNWDEGKLSGEAKFFRKDGSLEQILIYKNGIVTDSSLHFRPDGSLQEVQYFDSLGRLWNFKKFKHNGLQDSSLSSKKVLVIAESDTVTLEDSYQAYIRLGNHSGRKIEVVMGDINKDSLLYARKPRLSKLDSLTAVLNIQPNGVGQHEVKGLLIEIFYEPEKMIMLHPFEHSFYVQKK